MFTYTGDVQQWVVPASVVTFAVDAYGAAGGDSGGGQFGGLGGYISASNISASSLTGQTLFIYVGGAGAPFHGPGLGGGGNCISLCGSYNGNTYYYASGGGATDLRTSASDLSSR